MERIAPQALRKYLTKYSTPYPYNKSLFDLFTSRIDLERTTSKIYRRLLVFGKFLQSYQFDEPITWDDIEAALPQLPKTKRNKPKIIRSCLFNLGYILAELGKLESREDYLKRRSALRQIPKAPVYARPILHSYFDWLLNDRKNRFEVIKENLEILVDFYLWCERRDVMVPEGVQAAHINDYFATLYWQWQCTACQNTALNDSCENVSPKFCSHCQSINCYIKVDRYAQNTVKAYYSGLRLFFNWARINRLRVGRNPVQRKIKRPEETIRHYPPEVVERLCAYIVDPQSDPTTALILYLIIFHGMYIWELRHAQIPITLSMNGETHPATSLAKAYFLIIPQRTLSRGRQAQRRYQGRIDFWPEAREWLVPLLKRFERERQRKLRDPNNQFLLVTTGCSPLKGPVSDYFVYRCVWEASVPLLNAKVKPKILRRTAGIIFTEMGDANILIKLGWQLGQANKYNWLSRVVVHPT